MQPSVRSAKEPWRGEGRDMKRLVAFVAFTAFAAAATADEGETIALFEGRLSFALPDGFAVMSPEIAKVKYPNANRPRYIYANKKTTTSIAVNTMEAKLTDAQLPEFRDFMEKTMTRMIPGCTVLERDVITLNGQRWARLEFMSNAIDTDIHNVLLIAALDGQPVMFNFNSTKEEFPLIENTLTKSMNSIRISK